MTRSNSWFLRRLLSIVWGLWIIPNLIYRGFAGDAQRFQYLLVGEGRKAKAKSSG